MSVELSITNDIQPMKAIPDPKDNLLTDNLSGIQYEQLHQYVKNMLKNTARFVTSHLLTSQSSDFVL